MNILIFPIAVVIIILARCLIFDKGYGRLKTFALAFVMIAVSWGLFSSALYLWHINSGVVIGFLGAAFVVVSLLLMISGLFVLMISLTASERDAEPFF